MIQVHFDTPRQEPNYEFTNSKGKACSYERFTVEVTIKGDRRRIHCSKVYNGRLPLFDLAVRFSQGAKVWHGMADYIVDRDTVVNLQPCIDKRGHFTCAGFYEDFKGKAVQSNHNAM